MESKDRIGGIVVITGCSSGFGLETAALLAKEIGYKIIATMRNLKKKDELEKAAGHTLGKSLVIKELDMSKEESILKFMKETLESEGRIDVLINNAAIGQFGTFESVTLENMQAIFQTNFFGTMRLTQEAVREMKKQKSGQIIFISSIAGLMSFLFHEFYVATKHAVEGLAGCLAQYLQQFNISVTTIQPGPVQTPFITNITANKQGALPANSGDAPEEGEDPLSKALQEKYMAASKDIMKHMQSCQDVAEVIKACVKSEKPNLRMQTSDWVESNVKNVLVDPTGNQVTGTLADLLK